VPIAPLATAGWIAANIPAYARFRTALGDPRGTQLALLRSYLRRNADTAFGRRHRFGSIRSVQDFRERVGIASYDGYAEWIARIADGMPRVLTAAPVRVLQSTGGSIQAKRIPYTADLQAELRRAVGPWLVDLARRWPSAMAGRSYWAISPVARGATDDDAVRVGFEDDAEYLGGVWRRLVDRTLVAPNALRFIPHVESWRYVTLLFLLAANDLSFVSVWHPSFLTLLLDGLREHWDALIADLERGTLTPPQPLREHLRRRLFAAWRAHPARAARLRAVGPLQVEAIWPQLAVVSAWGNGHAAESLACLQTRMPQTILQPKGLLATEACVTIPFEGETPLAVRSHFFELVDEQAQAHLADELDIGGRYEVVVTTGGGLYRYALRDRVECTGFLKRTPILRFLGRAGHVSDLCGEKLAEDQVAEALRAVFADTQLRPAFAMLAPERDGERPGYILYAEIEGPSPPDLADRLHRALYACGDYAYASDLGQLAPARVFPIAPGLGFAVYQQRCRENGQRLGDIKPLALSPLSGWTACFGGPTARAAAGPG
jgi:hypothetical protein